MTIKLEKSDIINLVKSVGPSFDLLNHPVVKKLGSYSDNRGWTWFDSELNKIEELELFNLYQLCKNSWK